VVVDVLAGEDPAGLGWAGQRERLRAVGRLVDRLEAQRVRLVAAADRSGALADDGAATAASWLRRHSSLTAAQASDRAKLARRLPDLPEVAAAFAAGDLGVAHVIEIERLCRDVGVDQVAAVQTELVTAAGRVPVPPAEATVSACQTASASWGGDSGSPYLAYGKCVHP
jgi:hypothetical protein